MLRSEKHAFFLLLTVPLFWQAAWGGCPAGDLNRDCRIDFQDMQILGEQWLASAESPADLDGDGKVVLKDFAIIAESWRDSGNPLSINEFMASNSDFVRDSQGQYDDWIEIHNQAAAPIDVAGFYLTDDLDAPAPWRFPTGKPALTTIPPGGFLLVWADGDVGDSGLHANFALAAGGDTIYLLEPDGRTLIDSVEFREQVPNLSVGRYPDGVGEWRFMGMPTPAAPNVEMYQGFVAAPKLSHERGFYDVPFDVTLTCDTPGATLYYTLNGSEPYLTAGRVPTGTRYTGPIRISQSQVLRVKAVIPGWMPSPIATHTYIFLEQVVHQSSQPSGFPSAWGGTSADYMMDPDIVIPHAETIIEDLKSLPTMSLVMNVHYLFSSDHGIYANPYSEGVAWEHPGSIEMIYPDGEEGFQSNCGVRIYGGVGRREKKKSFRLLFKGTYGATKLRHPLFGNDATDEFDTIILRANFNDGYPFGQDVSQYIRDEYCRRLQLALGHPSPHGKFVHLYVNGLYWGLYNPTERADASFAASYFGGEKEDYDAYNSGSPTGDSSSQSWNALQSAVRSGLETNEGYQRLQGNNPDGTPNPAYTDYLDVESYIDFMFANIFVGNTDWPGHNWYGAMNRVNSTGFHFFMWDAEWVLGIQVGHGLDSDLYVNRTNVSGNMCDAYARLRNNPEFRLQFADQVHRAFFNNGPMHVDFSRPAWDPDRPETNRCAALYAELAEMIERAMVAESARWGDVHGGSPRTVEQWRAERDRLLHTYMAQRPGIVLSQLRNASLYPSVDAPVFNVNGRSQSGGHITATDALSLTGGGTLWYTLDGTDPRVPATGLPQNGDDTTIVLVAENALKKVLVPTGPVDDAWQSDPRLDDSAWIASAGKPGGVGYERSTGYEGYITANLQQLMYNVNPSCYIRIPFTVGESLDESDQITLQIRYDDGFVAYLNGVEVARRNFLGQPAWNSAASDQHSDGDAVNLENITLVGAKDALRPGTNILAIHGLNLSTTSSDFLISAALIAGSGGASGGGGSTSPSAVRYAGTVTLSHSARVKTRALSAGQWSALSEAVFAVGPVAESLRISEMMYHPDDTGSPNDPNTEYVELTNVGGETIDLNLVKFTNGI
ncbi:MAG: CotH kinase family protein, partial [Sedimentisphaerales bacterium]|nr:CotH kinase family protein [Sedimentisphaerales bacterium]